MGRPDGDVAGLSISYQKRMDVDVFMVLVTDFCPANLFQQGRMVGLVRKHNTKTNFHDRIEKC